jgi:hypothetical protein
MFAPGAGSVAQIRIQISDMSASTWLPSRRSAANGDRLAIDVMIAGVAVGKIRVRVLGLLQGPCGLRTIAVAEDMHGVAVLRGLLAPGAVASHTATVVDEPRVLRAS